MITNHGCNTKHLELASLWLINSLSEIHSGQDEQGGDFGRFSGIAGNKQNISSQHLWEQHHHVQNISYCVPKVSKYVFGPFFVCYRTLSNLAVAPNVLVKVHNLLEAQWWKVFIAQGIGDWTSFEDFTGMYWNWGFWHCSSSPGGGKLGSYGELPKKWSLKKPLKNNCFRMKEVVSLSCLPFSGCSKSSHSSRRGRWSWPCGRRRRFPSTNSESPLCSPSENIFYSRLDLSSLKEAPHLQRWKE